MKYNSKNVALYYSMYHGYLLNPRMTDKEMCAYTGKVRNTINNHATFVRENDILFPPQLRLKMTQQAVEFMYFIKVTDPIDCLSFLRKNGAFYICSSGGIYNLLVMSYKPMSISHIPEYRQTILSGRRGNYCVPVIPQQSYETAYSKIRARFKYEPEPDQLSLDLPAGILWNPDVWLLYHALKNNFRLKFTHIIKRYNLSVSSFYHRLEKIKAQTDVIVPFYPLGQMRYTVFHFLIKSKYHTFLIDCFSELPAFSLHCRVKDYLFSRVPISKLTDHTVFFELLSSMRHLGFIDQYEMAIPYRSEFMQPGAPLPAPSP